MKKYNVFGNTQVTVCMTVDAKNEDDAIAKAKVEFGGVNSYAGNGGCDKLIGVDGCNESISADDSVEFDDVSEA